MVRRRAVRLGDPRVDFEAGSITAWERANGRNASAGNENRPCETRLGGGNDKAAACVAQLLEAAKGAEDLFECADAVAQPGRIFVATTLR